MSTSTRWIYPSSDLESIFGLEYLKLFGFHNIPAYYKLDPHHHSEAYEFVYVEKGKATWEVDGVYHSTNAGDLFHTKPHEVHSARYNVIEPCIIWWFIISIPETTDALNNNWFLCSPEETIAAHQQLQQLPRIIPMGRKFTQPFIKLKHTFEQRDELTALKVRLRILDLLFMIFEQEALPNKSYLPIDFNDRLKVTLTEDWTSRPSVSELAQSLGYSSSHFYKVFREQAGLSPFSYMERLRIEEACRLLQDRTKKITAISVMLGYASSQHFASSFLRHVGQSPTSWRSMFS